MGTRDNHPIDWKYALAPQIRTKNESSRPNPNAALHANRSRNPDEQHHLATDPVAQEARSASLATPIHDVERRENETGLDIRELELFSDDRQRDRKGYPTEVVTQVGHKQQHRQAQSVPGGNRWTSVVVGTII